MITDCLPKRFDSLVPAESFFGFTYHAHMIPPFRPDHTLMLGYGGGTVPELMRKIWGQCKITAVDKGVFSHDYAEYDFIKGDALSYVAECSGALLKKRFDYIAVDLSEDFVTCDFVFWPVFVRNLREITKKMVCVNVADGQINLPRLKPYYDYGFKFERHVAVGDNLVAWWSVK